MSLNRLFRLISIALLLLFMTLAASLVAIEWGAYQRGAHSVQALSNFRLALITLEKVANERGPANAYMGVETAVNQVWRDELQRTRHDSDQAINQLIKALQADPDPRHPAVIEKVMILQRSLGPARLAIDRIAGQDRGQRDSAYIISAVDGMVDAIPLMVRVLADLAEIANQADPELRDGLSSVRVAASLREYAGQLGSLYTAPIVTRRPLNKDEVIEIGKLYGRIDQLRSLLETQSRSYRERPEFVQALATLDSEYFEGGFQFLNYLLQVGLKSGDYSLDTAELNTRYAPKMVSILQLRDVLLDDMLREAGRRNDQARNFLVGVVGLTLIACIFFILLMHLIRKRVVRPLVDAKNLVVSLAEGNLDANIPRSRHADEVGGMMRALQVLRARIMERNSLAREREELITQLQASSNTDFLTGVWNRRAFYTHAQQQMAVAQRYQRDLAIVMFDIDWFKRINDEYGHLAGDEILRGVAQTVQQLLRKVDVLARYGGEEFIVLLPESDLQNGMAVAQKLREALEQKSFVVDGGQELRVTASFGVAASVGQQALEQLIKLADEALYTAKDQGRNRVEMAAE